MRPSPVAPLCPPGPNGAKRAVTRWAFHAVLALLAACQPDDPFAPAKRPPSILGEWTGANAVAELEFRLGYIDRDDTKRCSPFVLFYDSLEARGTYRDLRTGQSVDICTYMQAPRGARWWIELLVAPGVVGNSPSDPIGTVKNNGTTLTGTVADSRTINAALITTYRVRRAQDVWHLYTGDSSVITLRRK